MAKLLMSGLFVALGLLSRSPRRGARAERAVLSRRWSTAAAPTRRTAFRSPTAVADYLNLLNARDGGINGVKITTEECETGYATDRGVECYERLKGKGPTGASLFMPLSTGITYALMEKVPADKIPLLNSGYGRTESADGNVVPWSFPILGTYWDAGDIQIEYIAKVAGRLGQAEGQEDRRRLSRLALRQGADPGVAGARQAARFRARSCCR